MRISRVLILAQLVAAAGLTPVVIGALGLDGSGVIVTETSAEPRSAPVTVDAPPPAPVEMRPTVATATPPAAPECKKVRVLYQGYGESTPPRCAPATATR